MKEIYPKLISFLEGELSQDTSGHSLDHALRVYHNAKAILSVEGGDERIVLIAALVHDVIDPKLFDDVEEQEKKLIDVLKAMGCSQEEIGSIQYIIQNISFKGGHAQPLKILKQRLFKMRIVLMPLGQ